jgi:hypothetical protein
LQHPPGWRSHLYRQAGHDPIFAAIDTHRNLCAMHQRMFEAMGDGPYEREEADRLFAVVRAACGALAALVATVPTTNAGRRALVVYADRLLDLHDADYRVLSGFRDDVRASRAATARALTV